MHVIHKINGDNQCLIITSGVSVGINSVSDPEEAWSVVTKQALELLVTGETAVWTQEDIKLLKRQILFTFYFLGLGLPNMLLLLRAH